MPKKARKPEPQTPALALNPCAAPTLPGRPPPEPLATASPGVSGVKATEDPAPALPGAETLAREIYRLAREQKDTATLLRLAQALYPQTFGPARAPQGASRPRRDRPGLRTAPARRGGSPVCWRSARVPAP